MSFFDDFADVVGQTISWEARQPRYADDRGGLVYDPAVSIPARVTEKAIEIQDPRGNRIVDGAEIWADPTYTISPGDRITLPSGIVTTVLPGSGRLVDEDGAASHQKLLVGRVGAGGAL